MIRIDKEILLQFFNELIIKQDYFECHEIMEEAWKDKERFKKVDAEVFLVLIVTGEYHYRRNNTIGASTSYKRALKLYETYQYHLEEFGFKGEFIDLLKERYLHLADTAFSPMHYPVQDWVYEGLYEIHGKEYTSFTAFTLNIFERFETDDALVNKHSRRDRDEVIEARLAALDRKLQHRKENTKKHL